MDPYSESAGDQSDAQGLLEQCSQRNSRRDAGITNDSPNRESNGEELYDQDRFAEETRLLAQGVDSTGFSNFSPTSSSATPMSSPPPSKSVSNEKEIHQYSQSVATASVSVDPLQKRDNSHSFHFRRRLANFRSDSMFSDVMPMASSSASQGRNKSIESESLEKSGSLSSLKPKESKWASLRKKLGKINTSTTKKIEQKQQSNPIKSVEEKRSLLQRAKTLSILPVRPSREKEDQPKKSKERKPVRVEEMFNVGGEMNMIPLELLIDVNDLKISN